MWGQPPVPLPLALSHLQGPLAPWLKRRTSNKQFANQSVNEKVRTEIRITPAQRRKVDATVAAKS